MCLAKFPLHILFYFVRVVYCIWCKSIYLKVYLGHSIRCVREREREREREKALNIHESCLSTKERVAVLWKGSIHINRSAAHMEKIRVVYRLITADLCINTSLRHTLKSWIDQHERNKEAMFIQSHIRYHCFRK